MGHEGPIIKILSARANRHPEKEARKLRQNGKAKSGGSVLIILALIIVLILLRSPLLHLRANDLWDVCDSRHQALRGILQVDILWLLSLI